MFESGEPRRGEGTVLLCTGYRVQCTVYSGTVVWPSIIKWSTNVTMYDTVVLLSVRAFSLLGFKRPKRENPKTDQKTLDELRGRFLG